MVRLMQVGSNWRLQWVADPFGRETPELWLGQIVCYPQIIPVPSYYTKDLFFLQSLAPQTFHVWAKAFIVQGYIILRRPGLSLVPSSVHPASLCLTSFWVCLLGYLLHMSWKPQEIRIIGLCYNYLMYVKEVCFTWLTRGNRYWALWRGKKTSK